MRKLSKKIRWGVFLPPWLLMIAIIGINLLDYDLFIRVMDTCTDWILHNFTGGLCLLSFTCVVVVVISYFSPLASTRVGGSEAKPVLRYRTYIWIILCTIMAAGILLWACSEPIRHIYAPPENIEAGSTAAVVWAMDTMFLEWTVTPMCIYTVPTLLFAFVFYNMKLPFTMGSMLAPLFGEKKSGRLAQVLDSVCLFALCAGMSASLGQGVLLLGGGLENYTNGLVKSGAGIWLICAIVIVTMFIISAATGVTKGIKFLSHINVTLYSVIGLCIFLFGPTVFLVNFGIESLGNYLHDFFHISLFTGAVAGEAWVQGWPGFYWCNWMAWMPITAVFMGKVSRGFTFRQVINATVVVPSAFSMVWLALFSGSAVYLERTQGIVYAAMEAGGTEAATFAVLRSMPFSSVLILLFLTILLISFVTAADSNTNAMSSLCTKGLTIENTESPTIGAACVIMLNTYGVDGIKKMSNLGGFPNTFLMILFIICWLRVLRNPSRYSKVK